MSKQRRFSLPHKTAPWAMLLASAMLAMAFEARGEGDVVVLREVAPRTATRTAPPSRNAVAVETSPRAQVMSSLGIAPRGRTDASRELGDSEVAMIVGGRSQAIVNSANAAVSTVVPHGNVAGPAGLGTSVGGASGGGNAGAAAGRMVTDALKGLGALTQLPGR